MRESKAEGGSVIFGIVVIGVLIGAGFFATQSDKEDKKEARADPTAVGEVAEEAPAEPARDAAANQ